MNIGTQNYRTQNLARPAQSSQAAEPPKSDSTVEKIVDNTYLSANYAASGLSGGASGLGAWGTSMPDTLRSTGSVLKNVYKSEKIGPTLRTLGLVAAVPVMAVGTAIAAPVSLFAGIWQGVKEVDSTVPRQFTVSQAAGEAYKDVGQGLSSVNKGIQEAMTEFGNIKLKPGEKPIDIPLIKAGKTLAMGAVGVMVGGAAGLVSAFAATVSEGAKGIVSAFGDSNLNIAEKFVAAGTSVVSAPVHGVLYGLRTGLATASNAVGQTWDKDSLTEGAKSIIKDVSVGVAASVAPHTVLTQEKQPEKQAS